MAVDEATQRLLDRLSETDSFRMAIKGHVLLEELLDEGLRDALVGGAAPEIMKLQFSRKAYLAVSLGIIDVDLRRLVHEIGRIRNGFAHGSIEALSDERARELIVPLHAVYRLGSPGEAPDAFADLNQRPALEVLRVALMGAHVALKRAIEQARADRVEREQALAAQRQAQALRIALETLQTLRREAEEDQG